MNVFNGYESSKASHVFDLNPVQFSDEGNLFSAGMRKNMPVTPSSGILLETSCSGTSAEEQKHSVTTWRRIYFTKLMF